MQNTRFKLTVQLPPESLAIDLRCVSALNLSALAVQIEAGIGTLASEIIELHFALCGVALESIQEACGAVSTNFSYVSSI